MKFFDSKYYAPLLKESVPNEFQKIRDISATQSRDGASLSIAILNAFCRNMPIVPGLSLSLSVMEKEWELVDDLTFYVNGYNLKNEGVIDVNDMVNKVYFDSVSEIFVAAVEPKDDIVEAKFVYCPFNVNPQLATQSLIDRGYLKFHTVELKNQIGVLVKSNYGFKITYNDIKHDPIDFDTMYNSDFKEISKSVVNHVGKDSNKGIIILHGLPGTGKTNYLRWLTGQTERKMVFIPTTLIGSLTDPVFMEFLLYSPGLTFIIEDAEDSLIERVGNRNSVVSNILNLTDGLLGDVLKCQFICTFNTEIDKIDKALLRPGRLLVSYEFKKLTLDVANRYSDSVGGIKIDKELTLSELININDMPTKSEPTVKRSIGFTGFTG